jgi:hypothetical protein
MTYKNAKFTLDIFDFKESINGITYGKNWNGWECPKFSKENGLKLIKLFDQYSDDVIINPLSYNKEKDIFVYDNGQQDDYEEFEPMMIDGKNYYSIGAYNWCWQIKRG